MPCDRCGQAAQGRLCATCESVEAMEAHWEAHSDDEREEVAD